MYLLAEVIIISDIISIICNTKGVWLLLGRVSNTNICKVQWLLINYVSIWIRQYYIVHMYYVICMGTKQGNMHGYETISV